MGGWFGKLPDWQMAIAWLVTVAIAMLVHFFIRYRVCLISYPSSEPPRRLKCRAWSSMSNCAFSRHVANTGVCDGASPEI